MKAILTSLLAVGLLAGCATAGRISSADRLSLYRSHAGEAVNSFRYSGSLNGWTELGDSALAVQTRPNEAWLLEFGHSCPGLDFASTIGLTSQFNRVQVGFDKVLVHGESPVGCRIASIRPLDTARLKEDLKQLRQARLEERSGE
jgi:hypothetical protein